MNYCCHCGQPTRRQVPEGDHFERDVCSGCGVVHYQNPKVVAGCIPVWNDRLLLCRRAIEPRSGFWTFPAGYLELGESSGVGAAREAHEETGVEVEIGALMMVMNIPSISQIYMIHRARALSDAHHATTESSETALLREDEIPWDDLAFPTVHFGLKFFLEDRQRNGDGFRAIDIHPQDWARLGLRRG